MGIENIRLGPCSLSFNNVDLGLTLGGVKLSIDTKIDDLPLITDKYANSNPRVTSMTVEVLCPLAETSYDLLREIYPWATLSQNKKELLLTDISGTSLNTYAKQLTITQTGFSGETVVIPLALPQPKISHTYAHNEERITQVNFLALPGTDGTLIKFVSATAIEEVEEPAP